MRAVDRSGVARPSSELWGYWIPDPSLLIGPRNEERVQRYMMNWLRIREGWLYLLGLPDTPATRVGAQWWRDYLNGDTANAMPEENTRRAERLEKVKTVFIRALLTSGLSVHFLDQSCGRTGAAEEGPWPHSLCPNRSSPTASVETWREW